MGDAEQIFWLVGGGQNLTPDTAKFGQLVRYLREKELDLTTTDLAAAAEISQGFLSGIENGHQAPSKEYAGKLLKFFRDQGVLDLDTEPVIDGRDGTLGRPDFLIKDPRSGATVAIEVKAKRKGDNRAHFDDLSAQWSRIADRKAQGSPTGGAVYLRTAGTGVDALYGNVVRRLAGASRDRLLKVESYLDQLDREAPDEDPSLGR